MKDTVISSDRSAAFLLKNEWFRQSVTPAFFFTSAFLTWGERENVRKVRERYVPDFSNRLDDYLQYAPAFSVAALSLSGKKGRNGWKRQTLSWGGGMLIMGALVNSIKYTAKVMRPDGTTRNSFPSGHTATAFMNAAFLQKEYGHVSPWYGVAGYMSSSYVGVSRSLNNRHWISDILAGAAIGIASTELSYLIVDHLYKNKGDYFSDLHPDKELNTPSYVSVRLGYGIDLGGKMISPLGIESAIEGAYYFNKRWGITAEAIFGNYPFPNQPWEYGDMDWQGTALTDIQQEVESAGFVYLTAGPQYAKALGSVFLLQLKLIGGVVFGMKGNMNLTGTAVQSGGVAKNTREVTVPYVEYAPHTSFVIGTGASITAMMTPRVGLSWFADFKQAKPSFEVKPSSKTFGSAFDHIRERTSTSLSGLSTGLKFTFFVD